MFRPANMILITSQAALFSVIPKPQFIQKTSDKEATKESIQSIFQNKHNKVLDQERLDRSLLDQKIEDLILQKTVDDVLEMADTDEQMDDLILAKEVAQENIKVHKCDSASPKSEIDGTTMINFTGFEDIDSSVKGESTFNKYKFKITEAMLNMSPLKSLQELEIFSSYLDDLKYKERIILNKEIQLGQFLVFQLKDFFFMYHQAQSLDLTDANSVKMERNFFWNNNRQLRNFRDFQFDKITTAAKEDIFHMKRERKLLKETTKKNKTQIKIDSTGSLSFTKGNLSPYIYNEKAKAGWFFRSWKHYTSKNMLTWEQYFDRSSDIDTFLLQGKNQFSYTGIISYLNTFANTGFQEISQLIKIYDLIPKHDLCLKEAFTRWILVNEKNLDYLIKKNSSENSNILIKNEALVLNMIDSIMKNESYKANERWESLLKFLKVIAMKTKLDSTLGTVKKPRVIRGLKVVKPIQNLSTEIKQGTPISKNIEVSVPIFIKLLEKTVELEKQTQSLRLIDCLKNGIKRKEKHKDKSHIQENDILIDLSSYFYKLNEVSTDETWLRYDDNLTDINRTNETTKKIDEEDQLRRQELVKLVCDNSSFKKCINNIKNTTYL